MMTSLTSLLRIRLNYSFIQLSQKKRGCNTVRDVIDLSEEEIIKTKNLGNRSVIEIAKKSIGISGTVWDYNLPKEKIIGFRMRQGVKSLPFSCLI